MAADRLTRPDPEALLRRYEAEQRAEFRGKLKVFLGYVSGVGKSYRMFDEGRRRRQRGQDVVVGAVQTKASPEVQCLLDQLEIIPLLNAGSAQVIDLDSIRRRHPEVCLVDGLAYDNPPGSRHPHRWQDVASLLDAGISVLTSINIQYIEELREKVGNITGKWAAQTVPVSFLYDADEIFMVDAPPEQLSAVAAGSTDGMDAPAAQQRLSELREIALLLAADVVDRQLVTYLERQGIQASWGTQERILVCITPRTNAGTLIASGRRNADRFHGELYVIYVRQGKLSAEDEQRLEENLTLAREANARVEILEGEDAIQVILDFARARGVTQIFIGHSLQKGWWSRLRGSPVDRLIRNAEGFDIQVFPHGG